MAGRNFGTTTATTILGIALVVLALGVLALAQAPPSFDLLTLKLIDDARARGVYVREKRALTLEEAVRKMSSAPAQRIGLGDRGVLRPGMKADIAIFDPAKVRDTATFDKPHQYAEGVSFVLVNGQVAFEGGKMTATRPGRVLYGPAKQGS
jgi:N-acyl-D-aspartate/D-glutamate deacylase